MADHRLYDDFAARLGDNIPDSEKPLVNSLLGEAEDTFLPSLSLKFSIKSCTRS